MLLMKRMACEKSKILCIYPEVIFTFVNIIKAKKIANGTSSEKMYMTRPVAPYGHLPQRKLSE